MGKTNAIIRFSGAGASQARRRLQLSCKNCIQCNAAGTAFELIVVEIYKHLGSLTTATLALGPEIAARSGSMYDALRPISGKLFRHPGLDVEYKLDICRSLLFSRGGSFARFIPLP